MTAPVLSIDTAYEPDLVLFARGRTDLYRELGAQFTITTLGQTAADRARVLRTQAGGASSGAPYRAIVVSTHGEASRVLDDDSPDGTLLSDDFAEAELKQWARSPAGGRVLYFCCCYTAQGPLFDRLLKLGASLVIGFTGQPSWSSTEGQRIWRDLDLEIVRSILNAQQLGAIERVRDHFLDRIENVLPSSGGNYRSDLEKMKKTLETMAIRGAAV